ncbi:MAG: hypothetical protein NXI20_00620 [bacterium]|nr:hypothetical protein [bacterium]
MKQTFSFLILILVVSSIHSQNVISEPDWSQDGKSIVFTRGSNQSTDIFISQLDNRNEKQITFKSGSNWNPAWSPFGDKIAFISNQNGNPDLYYYDLVYDTIIQITDSPEIEATPSWWSAEKLSLIRFNPKDRSRKSLLIDLNGNEETMVPDSSMQCIYPRISPTGDLMVFGGKTLNSQEQFHLFKKDLSSGEVTQIEDLPIVSYNPSWFPDGKQLAFINQSSKEVSSASIYSYSLETNQLTQLLECENGCYHPRVSPDGNEILYLDGWGKDCKGIFLLNLVSANSKQIK